ncbi:6245_t:CDS:1, partial [Rhizophagus irregularis]
DAILLRSACDLEYFCKELVQQPAPQSIPQSSTQRTLNNF